MRLFVRNLAWAVTETELRELFEFHSFVVSDVKVLKRDDDGRSRGFGFVTVDDGARAMREVDGQELFGRPVQVLKALERGKNGGSHKRSGHRIEDFRPGETARRAAEDFSWDE